MNPGVSVVLPCHRGHGMFSRAVESCLNQTLDALELIIVLHRADDQAKKTADHFRQVDARVQVLRSDGSFVEAVNAGHAAAKANFVARMDSDDVAFPSRFECQLQFLETRPEIDVVSCLVKITDPDGSDPREGFAEYEQWVNSITRSEEISAQRFVESPVVNPTAMFRRSAFDEVGGYRDTEWAEDYDLYLRLLESGRKIPKVPEVLHQWTDHAARVTRTQDRYSLSNFQDAKAHFLSRIDGVRTHGVVILGAGPTGKSMAQRLRNRSTKIHAFYEVHPRRIGEHIGGVPVLDQKDFEKSEPVALGAVARRGLRAKVRGLAESAGYREGLDFFSVA
ncbi:MAG: glycosyltransferase [Verrucomicrobiota bacterium]